jgi:glycosyltransferase involved in cell wall biosynthesis
MTDPLGQSQVINYLLGLTKLGYQFDILSFEKPDKFSTIGNQIATLLQENNIGWHPQIFHTKPPIFSKIYDRVKLFSVAKKLQQKNKYDLIHCRSYTAAEVGLKFKERYGVKFLFDMRGFWADEKADGGGWNREVWFWDKLYKFYKKKEKEFITNADHIISLTLIAKREIESWNFYNNKIPITVIPCCADAQKFLLIDSQKKAAARAKNAISKDSFVLSYLGSLGAWYMIDEMLSFFKSLIIKKPNAIFFIITNSDHSLILDQLNQYGLQKDNFRIITVPFSEVPQNMYASDCSISFIKPVYSKMSSSPVKTGEILNMGIPIIANSIGDTGILLSENEIGVLVKSFTKEDYNNAIDKIDSITKIDPNSIRETAIKVYSLEEGIKRYATVYQQLL